MEESYKIARAKWYAERLARIKDIGERRTMQGYYYLTSPDDGIPLVDDKGNLTALATWTKNITESLNNGECPAGLVLPANWDLKYVGPELEQPKVPTRLLDIDPVIRELMLSPSCNSFS